MFWWLWCWKLQITRWRAHSEMNNLIKSYCDKHQNWNLYVLKRTINLFIRNADNDFWRMLKINVDSKLVNQSTMKIRQRVSTTFYRLLFYVLVGKRNTVRHSLADSSCFLLTKKTNEWCKCKLLTDEIGP